MIGKISINGHIGDSYVDSQGQAHVGTNLLSVIDQVANFPDALAYEVSINSPGGYVDVGDAIYDYLLSLKKQGKTITTIQTGLIGSIATKLFLAGDRRIADDRYQFWIHNPFQENVSGDADAMQAAADLLGATEKNLRKFYAEFTQISDEGLDGLMKIETGLSADQCIKFKFATEKKLVPAFNTIKINKMANKKDDKSFMEHVKAYFVAEKPKGVQPKAEIPTNEAKSMVVNLADGSGAFWVEGELVEGANAFLLDEAQQPTMEPLADGDYPVDGGSVVSVAGGVITAVAAPEEEAAVETLTKEMVQEMINAAVGVANEKAALEIAAVKEQAQKETEAKIKALKGDIKLGIQPKNPVLSGSGVKLEYKSINDKMREKAEARKKQLNNN
jgi:ATP-dependent protease ClpP protease subunit